MKTALLSIFLVLFITSTAAAVPTGKIALLERLNDFSFRLQVLAKTYSGVETTGEQTPPKYIKEQIAKMLANEQDIAFLERVYLRALQDEFLGNAGDENIDTVYETAVFTALERIEKIGGQAAIHSIERLQMISHPDGVYAVILDEALQRLHQKL